MQISTSVSPWIIMTWYSSGRFRKRLNLHAALDVNVSKSALWLAVVLYFQEIKLKELV